MADSFTCYNCDQEQPVENIWREDDSQKCGACEGTGKTKKAVHCAACLGTGWEMRFGCMDCFRETKRVREMDEDGWTETEVWA